MENKQVVSLLIESQVFNVKKDKLIEYSDYFRAMFSGNYIEKEQHEISIDVVDANSMNIILRYMELGLIDLSEHSLSTVGDLAVAANFLQITELSKQIDYCLEQQLSLSNWMEIKDIAQNAASAKLEQASVTYGLFSFKSMKPEFIQTIDKLFWYLSHPYLDTESELQVFKFGLQWVECEEMGADTLRIILCCLDFNRLTREELTEMKDLIKDYVNSLVEKVVDCLHNILTNYKLTLTDIKQNRHVLCELYTEKVYTEVLNLVKESIQRKLRFIPAVPMWSNKDKKPERSPNYMFTYIEESGFQQWMEIAEKDLWGWSIASWGATKIVVVCGEYGRGTGIFMKDVKVYDIHKKEWIRHGVELPVRRHAGVVIVEDSLFILGGVGAYRFQDLRIQDESDDEKSDSDELDDEGADSYESDDEQEKTRWQWEECPKMVSILWSIERKRTGPVEPNQKPAFFHVTKRLLKGVMLDSAIIYDLKQRTFRKIARLPDIAQSPAVCVHENVVYAVGITHIYKYEDKGESDQWSEVINTDLKPTVLVSFKGYIYVSQSYFPYMYRFRPNVDSVMQYIVSFSHPPMAICNLGYKLLAITSSGDMSTDIMNVEEYQEAPARNVKILWSMTGSKFSVNPTGSCLVVMTPPPVNPDISLYHQRYITMYG